MNIASKKSTQRTWVCVAGFAFAFCQLLPCVIGVAHASRKVCVTWFKKAKFERASQCFLGLAKALEGKLQTPQVALEKGLLVRNASLALRRAAKATPAPEERAYHRERALLLMRRYIKEKLYGDKIQKQNAESVVERLMSQIGYARLVVLTGTSNARIELSGFRFKSSAKGRLLARVRPGDYNVVVLFAGGLTKAKTLRMLPHKPKVLKFSATAAPGGRIVRRRAVSVSPAPVGKPNRTPGWIVLAAGGALVGVGVGMAIAASSADHQRGLFEREYRNQVAQNLPVKPEETARLRSAWEASNQWLVASLVTGGAGLALATVGVVMALAAKPTRPPAASAASAAHATSGRLSLYAPHERR